MRTRAISQNPSRLITFRELAAERMASKRMRLAPASLQTDGLRLKPLLAAFGRRAAREITPADIDKFLADLVESGRSRSTANRYHSLLSSIFSFAVRNGWIDANPCKRVQRLKENPGSRACGASEAKEEIALRCRRSRRLCPDREAEFDLALNTGLRRGEQFGLRRDGVDLQRGILTVSGNDRPPLQRFRRSTRWRAQHLRNFWPDLKENSFAGKSAQGDATGADGLSAPCAGTAEHPIFHWHDLRHTFASRLVMAGVDIRSVQDLLGHRSIVMTMRYAHLSPAHQQANVERLVRSDGQRGLF